MKVEVKKISLENYKKFPSKSVDLFPRTEISGRNREGKSTLQDAYLDVLTGKMANGKEPTSIRRKENGVEVPKVDVVRELTLAIDGKEKVIRKITKQKWRKPRGQSEEVFDGNETSYEIDGFPAKSKDYTEFIQSIAEPSTLLMCSNPKPFLDTLQKSTAESRKVLEKMSGFDIAQFMEENQQYAHVEEITKGHSVEDTLKKLRKELNAQKKKVDAKNTEIAYETNRSVEAEDTSSLESKKQELNAELSKLEEQERILEDSAKGYDSLSYEIRGLKSSRDGLVSKANEWLRARQKFISDTVSELRLKKSEKESSIRIIGMELDNHIREAQQAKADLDRARQDYPRIKEMEWDDSGLKAIEAETFNDSDTICPTCGQELPEEQVAELRASFEEKKKARIEAQLKVKESFESEKQEKLKYVCDLGNTSAAKLKKTNEEINKLQSKISVAQDEVAELTKQIEEEQSKFTELPESVDMTNDEEYLAVTARIAELEEKLKSFDDVPGKKQELRMQISNVMKQISNVDADIKIAQAAVTEKEKRVAELNEELKSLGQVQADIEKNIDTVLNFSIQKNKTLAEKINPHFKHFQFSFLDYTIEGNPVETCKMICNGVNYFDGLNYSDKILCDIDLLRGLQALNGLNLPIFVDNSESINTTRLPNTEQQMIVLRVTDGDLTAKEL
uniref:Chromosome partition protein n=1 Tax=Siphoviridae sp. ctVif31 TaxID=2825532 RepID=A0A8S5Q432_9CAUD|nr:MAG TPA: chromosome partition protein [Siphoviridae sp. ctVif31]